MRMRMRMRMIIIIIILDFIRVDTIASEPVVYIVDLVNTKKKNRQD